MTDIDPESSLSKSSAITIAGYWITLAAIIACIVGVWMVTAASRFADFDTYVLYLDQLVHFPPANWWYFETLSNSYLLLLHNLTQSVETSIEVAHYLLAVIFVLFLVAAFPPKTSSWASILFFFCLLGPALAFVTLRATPAYFLIAIAALHAIRHDRRTWIYTLVAFLFHASALLAIPPMALLYWQDRLPGFMKGKRSLLMFAGMLVLLFPVAILLPQITRSAVTLIQSTPYLSKYIAYTDEVLPSDHVTSVNHYIFLVFVVIYSGIFFAKVKSRDRRIFIYALSSLFIYVLSFFSLSPVAAFRQAPFFLLPMISLFPWRDIGLKGAMAFFFALACGGLFYFQFDQVYV
jgi:hypothetical protein